MKYIYDIVIRLYFCSIYLAQFFNQKAKLWIKGRKNIWQKISQVTKKENQKNIWIHVSSLGEFEQGRPVIEAIKKNINNVKIILTFFSPSGYEIRKNYAFADYIFYLPLDTKKNVKKFYSFIKPDVVIFVKYDFWYNYLNEAHKQNIPLILISATFKQQSIFFKPYGRFFKNMLNYFTKIFVQDENSQKLLHKINIDSEISGDTRCDRVIEIAQNANLPDKILNIINNKMVIVVGSAWKKDIKIIKKTINYFKDILWIIAPHNIEKQNIDKIIQLLNKKVIKYSEIVNNQEFEGNILIIDNIGMLASLYKTAYIAYVGGGFGKGIHNILEPAVYGIPVIFGPNFIKFNEAVDLIKLKAAFTVKNETEAFNIFKMLITDQELRNICEKNAKNYVIEKAGATNIIVNYLNQSFLSR